MRLSLCVETKIQARDVAAAEQTESSERQTPERFNRLCVQPWWSMVPHTLAKLALDFDRIHKWLRNFFRGRDLHHSQNARVGPIAGNASRHFFAGQKFFDQDRAFVSLLQEAATFYCTLEVISNWIVAYAFA